MQIASESLWLELEELAVFGYSLGVVRARERLIQVAVVRRQDSLAIAQQAERIFQRSTISENPGREFKSRWQCQWSRRVTSGPPQDTWQARHYANYRVVHAASDGPVVFEKVFHDCA